MKEEKLRQIFKNASNSFIRSNCDSHTRLGPCAESKESKGMERKVLNDKRKDPTVEEIRNGSFKVTITFLASDRRRRDLDNGTSTILDMLPALRRQLECHFGIKSEGSKSK